MVISHEKGATQRLFASVKMYIDLLDVKPTTSIDSKSEIRFPFRGSSYFIGTAGQKAFGRGDTVALAHLSEAAFYPELVRILNGIAEAAEYGEIDIETSPNGREAVYDLYQKAKAGMSSYTAIFIPWFIDQEYSADNLSDEEKNGLSAGVQAMFSMPDDEFMKTLDDGEKKLVEMVERDWAKEGCVMTPGMLKWRRAKIWDKGEIFFQEYPEDDVSCFLQSGRSVFSEITLDPTKRIPLDNYEAWAQTKGITTKQQEIFKNKMMFGGIDPAVGTANGDGAVFSVIDVDMETGKAAVVFEYRSTEPSDIFCQKVANVMNEFNIWLGVENNGVGQGTIKELRHLGIRFLEWETTGANRTPMIMDLEKAYRTKTLVETYPEAENEARDMVYIGEPERPDHKEGKHDDRVISRSIAWQMRNKPLPGVTYL